MAQPVIKWKTTLFEDKKAANLDWIHFRARGKKQKQFPVNNLTLD